MSTQPENLSTAKVGTVTCVACNTPCSLDQKFCLNCGEGLWFECPDCNESNPVNSSFCGSCGSDLKHFFSDSDEFFKSIIQDAKAKATGLDLTAAIRILLSAVDSTRIHLKSQKNQIIELVKKYRAQKTEQKSELQDRYEKAKFQFEKSALSNALKILEEIPEGLRSVDAEELLQTVRFQVAEAKRLSGQIEQCIQKRDLISALPKVESLLEYRPGDEKLTKLASDIVARVIKTATKWKREGKHSDAHSLLKKIPQSIGNDQTSELKAEIGEILWLANYVQRAQVLDGSLHAAIGHLYQSAPTAENKKILSLAQAKLEKSGSSPANWSVIPKNTPLGMPVAYCPPLKIIERLATVSVDGYDEGAFLVAAGLAIQGIGKSTLSTDLLERKKSFLGFRGKRAGKVAWGLDFGQSSLKAIKITCESEHLELTAFERIQYRNSGPGASSAEQRSNMLEALLALKSKHDIKKDEGLSVNLNPAQVLARYLQLPDSGDKQLRAAMEFEIKHQIPFPLEEVNWDHHVFPNPVENRRQALVIASRKTDTTLIEEMFSANSMKITGIQSESVALYNLLILNELKSGSTACNAYLDVGDCSSTVTIIGPSQIWFRSFGIGANSFAKSLSRQLKVTQDQAHEYLKDLSQTENRIGKALMAMADPYQELVNEIHRSFQAYETDMHEKKPGALYLLGGASRLNGLLTYLRHDLDSLKVR